MKIAIIPFMWKHAQRKLRGVDGRDDCRIAARLCPRTPIQGALACEKSFRRGITVKCAQ